jgi:hypothetical protein
MVARADEHAANVKRSSVAWSKKLKPFNSHLLSKLMRIRK